MNTVTRGSLAAAIALALGVGHAEATTFNVTNTDDSGAGSLRQALLDAAGDSNIPHTIDLSAIAGQTINVSSRLTMSPAGLDIDLTIIGSDVTVASDGSSGVMQFGNPPQRGNGYYGPDLDVTISDLTVSGGDAVEPGGGILMENSGKYQGSLTLENVTVTGNSSQNVGGGVAVYGGNLTVNDSTISGNTAATAGGLFHTGGRLSVNRSAFTDNVADGSGYQPLGERWALAERAIERGGPIGGVGGGLAALPKYGAEISESTVSGNTAEEFAGGIAIVSYYSDIEIRSSSISGNSAEQAVGGAYLGSYYGNTEINASTISGNSAEYLGGALAATYDGSVFINNSTVSGNSADEDVGGIFTQAIYGQNQINFSTIANNTVSLGVGGAVMSGGGYIGTDEPRGVIAIPAANTAIISGNQPNDLGTGGGPQPVDIERLSSRFPLLTKGNRSQRGLGLSSIDVNFSLLGSITPGLNLDATSTDLLGQNPLLGPLANNGGPTFTHLIGDGSPAANVVSVGSFGCGTDFSVDQRGESRPFDGACDLGAAELQGGAEPGPAPLAVPIGNRLGLLLMAGLLGLVGLLGMRRRRSPLI